MFSCSPGWPFGTGQRGFLLEEMWRQYRERGPEDVEPEANPEPSTDCYSLETPISTEEMWRQYEREANLAETCELFKNL